jgi:predicted permease
MFKFIVNLVTSFYIPLFICTLIGLAISQIRKWKKGAQYEESIRYEYIYPSVIFSILELSFLYKKNHELFYYSLFIWSVFYLLLLIFFYRIWQFEKNYKSGIKKNKNYHN